MKYGGRRCHLTIDGGLLTIPGHAPTDLSLRVLLDSPCRCAAVLLIYGQPFSIAIDPAHVKRASISKDDPT